MRPPKGSKAAGKGKAAGGSAKKAAKGGKKKDGGGAAAAAAAAGPAAAGPAVWRPGQDGIGEDEALQYDPSAYDCLHALTLEWPCLRCGARRCTTVSGQLHTRFYTHPCRGFATRLRLAHLATCPLQCLQRLHPFYSEQAGQACHARSLPRGAALAACRPRLAAGSPGPPAARGCGPCCARAWSAARPP